MIGVITGDIINSRKSETSYWLSVLKNSLDDFGNSPGDWEIFRGDSFQLQIADPKKAFLAAVKIKADIKSHKNLDIRTAIGVGEKDFESTKITESNGEAFVNSGQGFEQLKSEKKTLSITTFDTVFNEEMNLYLRLMLIAMDKWSPGSAEIVSVSLMNPEYSQHKIGKMLGISQSSVSERQTRSYLSEVMEVEKMYRKKIAQLTPKK
ncbi:MAG: transcriptional regulator [Balneolaceae bacterium]